MTDRSTVAQKVKAPDVVPPLCWICNRNEANSREHKTKRSDLLAVLGNPTQAAPFYYHDLSQPNRPVKSLNAKVLKAPIRICVECNSARTQPHDRAWERMSEYLRKRHPPIKVDGFVRCNRIFRHDTRREMTNVHLYFLKLFGCMLCEVAPRVPIDIAPFSDANERPCAPRSLSSIWEVRWHRWAVRPALRVERARGVYRLLAL